MSIHDGEVAGDVAVVERLDRGQHPDPADRGVTLLGGGTDNTMYRLGNDLLVRLPRTAETSEALAKELRWLPQLAPLLRVEVPTPLYEGAASKDFPFPWAIYRWIEGDAPSRASVTDWAGYGRDLAGSCPSFTRSMCQPSTTVKACPGIEAGCCSRTTTGFPSAWRGSATSTPTLTP